MKRWLQQSIFLNPSLYRLPLMSLYDDATAKWDCSRRVASTNRCYCRSMFPFSPRSSLARAHESMNETLEDHVLFFLTAKFSFCMRIWVHAVLSRSLIQTRRRWWWHGGAGSFCFLALGFSLKEDKPYCFLCSPILFSRISAVCLTSVLLSCLFFLLSL